MAAPIYMYFLRRHSYSDTVSHEKSWRLKFALIFSFFFNRLNTSKLYTGRSFALSTWNQLLVFAWFCHQTKLCNRTIRCQTQIFFQTRQSVTLGENKVPSLQIINGISSQIPYRSVILLCWFSILFLICIWEFLLFILQ